MRRGSVRFGEQRLVLAVRQDKKQVGRCTCRLEQKRTSLWGIELVSDGGLTQGSHDGSQWPCMYVFTLVLP